MEEKDEEGPVAILRREMGLENNLESDEVVYKRDSITVCGNELVVRRVFVLYGSYRVGWVHDADVHHCMICESDFGFFKRKHHCRACGSVVCSTCSPYRAPVPSLDDQSGVGEQSASRVCNKCFGLKMKIGDKPRNDDMNGILQKIAEKRVSVENASEFSIENNVTENAKSERKMTRKKEKKAEFEATQFQLLEQPKYSKAYRKMRAIIPPFIATLSLESLIDTGLPKAVAERIWSKRCLWLIVMHPQDILKIHIADLRSKYTPIGLDLTERYAVWYNLPDWGQHAESDAVHNGSPNSDKIEWKLNFKIQMDEMARKHKKNELAQEQVRHSAYVGHEPIHLFSHRAIIPQLYTNNNGKVNAKHFSVAASSSVDLSAPSFPAPTKTVEISSSPGSSACSSHISSLDDCDSPVVPLFIHRNISNGEKETEASRSTSPSTTKDCIGITSKSESASSNLLPTLEQQKLKREERIQERKRRTTKTLPNYTRLAGGTVEGGSGGDAAATRKRRGSTGSKRTLTCPTSDTGKINSCSMLSKVLSTPILVPEMAVIQNTEPVVSSKPPAHSTSEIKSQEETTGTTSPERICSPMSLHGEDHKDQDMIETPTVPTNESGDGEIFQTPPSEGRSRRNSRTRRLSDAHTPISNTLMSSLIESDLPRITVTPLRDLMSDNTFAQKKNAVEVMKKIQSSEISLTAQDATELLKYAVVNLMDMRQYVGSENNVEDMSLDDDIEYENAMISIIEVLVTKCGADIDTMDVDGNNLLTFLQESVTADMSMSSRLVPTLLRLGVNILVIKDKAHHDPSQKGVLLDIHPMLVSLSKSEMLELIDYFSLVSSVELTETQKFSYFALLIIVGRASMASLVLRERSIQKLMQTSDETQLASSLLKICNFDSGFMEDPLDTFELLDHCGAKL